MCAINTNNFFSLSFVEFFYGRILIVKGDGRDVISHIEKAIEYCEQGQIMIILDLAWAHLGGGYYFLGELETALEHVNKGLKIHIDTGKTVYHSWFYWFLGMIYFDLDKLQDAQNNFEEALMLSRKNQERRYYSSI